MEIRHQNLNLIKENLSNEQGQLNDEENEASASTNRIRYTVRNAPSFGSAHYQCILRLQAHQHRLRRANISIALLNRDLLATDRV